MDFEIGKPGNEDLKNRCFRYWQFLSNDQREELRVIQNRVINSLVVPPSDYELIRDTDPETRSWYMAKFEPLASVDPRLDTWLRYYAAEHVDEWADYLLRQMPHFLGELERRRLL